MWLGSDFNKTTFRRRVLKREDLELDFLCSASLILSASLNVIAMTA